MKKLKNTNLATYQVAEVQVSYERGSFPTIIADSQKVFEKLFRENWDNDLMELQEQLNVIFLANDLSVIGFRNVFTGGSNSCTIEPRIIMMYALQANAKHIAVCHNHPSGNCFSSSQDVEISKKIRDAGKVLNIELLDSFIITKSFFRSISF